jgi:phenylacetate-CoA ligase
MRIDEFTINRFIGEWRRNKPDVLFGHSRSLYIVATYLQKLGCVEIRPRSIVSTSMMLLEPERRLIEKTFSCPVTNRYGCEEVGLIASECERREGFHINSDHLIVEFLRDDGTVAGPGEESNVVVTDLINLGMPLIRYCVEDKAVPSDRSCTCGRGLPLMENVMGRQADYLKCSDGSLVAGVSLVERTLTAFTGISQMQFVQNDLHRLNVKIVKDCSFSQFTESGLRSELQRVFGEPTRIEIEYVSCLEQTRAGKYRFAICNV